MTLWDQFKQWVSGGAQAVTLSGVALSLLTQRAFWVRFGLFVAGFFGIIASLVILFRRPLEGAASGVVGTAAKAAVI